MNVHVRPTSALESPVMEGAFRAGLPNPVKDLFCCHHGLAELIDFALASTSNIVTHIVDDEHARIIEVDRIDRQKLVPLLVLP